MSNTTTPPVLKKEGVSDTIARATNLSKLYYINKEHTVFESAFKINLYN
jgi:hypothetical protein